MRCDLRALLSHRTAASGLRLSAAMGHVIDGLDGVDVTDGVLR